MLFRSSADDILGWEAAGVVAVVVFAVGVISIVTAPKFGGVCAGVIVYEALFTPALDGVVFLEDGRMVKKGGIRGDKGVCLGGHVGVIRYYGFNHFKKWCGLSYLLFAL